MLFSGPIAAGLQSLTNHSPSPSPIVHAVREAAKKICGSRLGNRKDRVSPVVTRKLANRSNLHNLPELRNVCIFVLAYSGFFTRAQALAVGTSHKMRLFGFFFWYCVSSARK